MKKKDILKIVEDMPDDEDYEFVVNIISDKHPDGLGADPVSAMNIGPFKRTVLFCIERKQE